MIYDYFRVTDTVLEYADLFFITLLNDNVQDFDTSWDEILLSMTKIPSDDVLVSLYKFRIRVSEQGDSSKDIDAQLSKVEDDGEKEHRSESSMTPET